MASAYRWVSRKKDVSSESTAKGWLPTLWIQRESTLVQSAFICGWGKARQASANMASARFFNSSGGTSSLCVENIQA